MEQKQGSQQCYRIKQAQEAENAAARRHMARQAMRNGGRSDGVVERAPSVRQRVARLLGHC